MSSREPTLIVVATEFGRPGGFGGGGRGHHAACFTMVPYGARIRVIQRPRSGHSARQASLVSPLSLRSTGE